MEHAPLELVRRSAAYLAGKGVSNPRLDAEVLLAHVLGVPRIQLYLQFDKPLAAAEVDAYREAVRRRARREPVAHITGSREFWSLSFAVDARVLVPRPETEVLVEAALARMGGAGRLADLGTGSGAVAVALLVEHPGWTGVAVDVSTGALEVAAVNAARHGVGDRLDLRRGDLFAPLAGSEESFDAVVANPPYIPTGELGGLEPEVSRFDPRLALDGGPDGLDVIRRIAAGARAFLAPGGFAAVEFGAGQEGAVGRIFRDAGGYEDMTLVPDLAGRPRVAVAEKRDG
ncbi:MAG: peptide chain release factor N(5)-glutamine methyltransferase [Thermodesulfobacteriota bacterium]